MLSLYIYIYIGRIWDPADLGIFILLFFFEWNVIGTWYTCQVEPSVGLGLFTEDSAAGDTGNDVGNIEQSTVACTPAEADETNAKDPGKLVDGGGRSEEQPTLRDALG